MNMLITTGCTNSCWEMVIPVLKKSGFELADSCVSRWLDEYFQTAATADLMQVSKPLPQGPGWGGDVAAYFSKNVASSVLLADSRHIWLLDFWVNQFPMASFLLFFTSSETALAHALQHEVEPQKFLEHWQAANRELLNFHRRHRQCTLLLDAEAVTLNPLALESVCRRVGLTLKPTVDSPIPAAQPSAVARLLAKYLLASQPAVQKLQMELEASSPPLGDIMPKLQIKSAELIDSFRQGQSFQRKLEQAQQTLKKQEAAHLEAKNQVERQEATHREAVRENELLLQQLHQVQEELEHYFIKWQDLSGQRQRELNLENGKIDKLRENEKAATSLPWNKATKAIASLFNKKRKERKKIQKQANLLKGSGLFDEAWYFSAYPDVAGSGIDPVKHYLIHGAAEGRDPSPAFNTRAYLAANPDIVAAGMNPLVHFVKFGRSEGRPAWH